MKLRGLGFTEASYDKDLIKGIVDINKEKEPDLFST
jgi:hypothetical protein